MHCRGGKSAGGKCKRNEDFLSRKVPDLRKSKSFREVSIKNSLYLEGESFRQGEFFCERGIADVRNHISRIENLIVGEKGDIQSEGGTLPVKYVRYFLDCGIAHCISGMTPMNNSTAAGMLMENFIYTELYRLYKTRCLCILNII